MVFLKHFILPSLYEEEIGNSMTSAYPYGIFPFKELENIGFKSITIFYGGNGSGKSTIAFTLQNIGLRCIVLDGDEMRDSISLNAGFSRKDRAEHNLKVARLARELSQQMVVLVSVIAPIERTRKEIDDICAPYWFYIERNLPEKEGHFYEAPKYPDFILNHNKMTIADSTSFAFNKINKLIGRE